MGTAGRRVCWILIGLILALGTTKISWATTDLYYKEHRFMECGYTRYPQLCAETLSGLGSGGIQHVDILSALVNKTMYEHQLPVSNFTKLSYHFISLEAQHARITTGYCHELMDMSLKRLNQALSALKESPRKNKQNIQTWVSAALTFQEACKDSAEERDGLSNQFMGQISQKMGYLSQLTSNTLALVNRITGKTIPKGRKLLAKEQIFPGWVSAKDRKLLQSNTNSIQANAVVAKDGSGNYQTVAEAINAASGGGRFVIYVKSGVYKEKIRTKKDGITLIGDGKYSTIIVGDDSAGRGSSTKDTATFSITGDGFIAKDIGFQNIAGPAAGQAVALLVASDRSVIYRCSISGNQDTLYALSLRQFYRECDIYGTVDFIFGNAAAVFQNCYLVLRHRSNGGSYSVILASGRSDPGQNTGFSVQNCKISVASDFSSAKHSFNSYLGRPWKQYSRSVVMQSTIDAIAPQGWVEWPGASSSSLKTLYFAEYANLGPGATASNRVKWPGFHLIGEGEAIKFTVGSFISGASWIPSTGVDFVSGL